MVIPVTYQEAARQKNIFLPLFKKESPAKEEFFSHLPESIRTAVLKLAKEEFRGEEGETKSAWFPRGNIKRIKLFGFGDKTKWNYRKEPLVARHYVRYAKEERINEFVTPFAKSLGRTKKEGASIFAANALMADFEFNQYKEKPKEGWPEVKTIYLAASQKDLTEIGTGIKEGLIIGEETNNCRELANTPGGDMTPEVLAQNARQTARKNGLRVKILGGKDLKKLGMGGILGVSKGSVEKPRFIILEYLHGPRNPASAKTSAGKQKPLVLVGKGVTFDTGGLNLKPSASIYEMHMDMSGGAAVIHGLAAIARLKLPINAVGIVPAVENMTSGSSYRPGDLLKSMSGKTIEVLNTDAEGRIILADALWYGAIKYKPGLLIDFATLTGAAHAALGSYCSALLTNREDLFEKLIEVGKKSGDYVWPLPLWDEYLSEIKGNFGDIANDSESRYGGAIHGAKFLEQFINNTPFAHIDIAPRMTAAKSEYLAKGASGVGVRYIVELAKQYSNLIK